MAICVTMDIVMLL